jgi:Actinobacteria/chloroflexi VLRF1 release factor
MENASDVGACEGVGVVAKRGTGAPRWVEVSPERIGGWIASFAERHGPTSAEQGPGVVVFRAADGAVAECHAPFPPLRGLPSAPGADPVSLAGLMAGHAAADRTVGVLLVRLGGYAAGVFSGAPPRLEASKVGARLVHGRSAAGGWSQHRFARRREKQAATALDAAADTAVAVLGPHLGQLDAVVLGGDRRTVAGLRDDARLAPYFDRAVERFLTVPDPRLAVLRETPRMFRSVRIRISERDGAGN